MSLDRTRVLRDERNAVLDLCRTLTDAEVNEAHQKIIEEVNRKLGGSLRGVDPA